MVPRGRYRESLRPLRSGRRERGLLLLDVGLVTARRRPVKNLERDEPKYGQDQQDHPDALVVIQLSAELGPVPRCIGSVHRRPLVQRYARLSLPPSALRARDGRYSVPWLPVGVSHVDRRTSCGGPAATAASARRGEHQGPVRPPPSPFRGQASTFGRRRPSSLRGRGTPIRCRHTVSPLVVETRGRDGVLLSQPHPFSVVGFDDRRLCRPSAVAVHHAANGSGEVAHAPSARTIERYAQNVKGDALKQCGMYAGSRGTPAQRGGPRETRRPRVCWPRVDRPGLRTARIRRERSSWRQAQGSTASRQSTGVA